MGLRLTNDGDKPPWTPLRRVLGVAVGETANEAGSEVEVTFASMTSASSSAHATHTKKMRLIVKMATPSPLGNGKRHLNVSATPTPQ